MKPHTGQRKRPIGARQIEAMSKGRPRTRAERDATARLYAPAERNAATLCSIEGCDLGAGTACVMTGCPGRYRRA